jgi:hypothetical protein
VEENPTVIFIDWENLQSVQIYSVEKNKSCKKEKVYVTVCSQSTN